MIFAIALVLTLLAGCIAWRIWATRRLRHVIELPHTCWPYCSHATHYRHIPSPADAWMDKT